MLCGVVVHQIENVDRQTKKAQERSKKRDKDNEATVQTKDTKHRFYREYFESNIFAQLVRFSFFSFLVASFMLR